jgi:hypothetical protein
MLPERNVRPIFESMDPKVTMCQTVRAHIPEDSNFHPQCMSCVVRDKGLQTYKTIGASRP